MRVPERWFLIGVAVALLSGCASPVVTAAAAPAVADSLTFSGTTLDGSTFDARTLTGKPVILWFWAPWCATCASEAQSINDLRTQYGDRLGILGVAGLGDNKAMHQFVSDLDVKNVNLDDGAGVIWKKFGITEQSTYVLVNKAGQVVITSYLDDLQLTDKVTSLVA